MTMKQLLKCTLKYGIILMIVITSISKLAVVYYAENTKKVNESNSYLKARSVELSNHDENKFSEFKFIAYSNIIYVTGTSAISFFRPFCTFTEKLYTYVKDDYMIDVAIKSHGFNIIYLNIFGVLPHGIFECTAVFVCFVLSYMISLATVSCWVRMLTCKCSIKNSYRRLAYSLYKSFLYIVLVVVPVLLFAALIETFITPQILDSFMYLVYPKH